MTAHNSRKTQHMIERAEGLHDRFHRFFHSFSIRNVDGDAEDALFGEILGERENCGLGAAERGF